MRRDRSGVARALRRISEDERNGDLMHITEAAQLLGTPVATVRRWVVDGFKGARLDAVNRGGSWFTSRRACTAFLRRLYEMDDAEGWVGRSLF